MNERQEPEPSLAPDRALARHVLATLAYRVGRALDGAPAGFAEFEAGEGSRTPAEILAHISDLLDWALSMARGAPGWNPKRPHSWTAEIERFRASIRTLDDHFASDTPIERPIRRIFQGPLADALTHVGQLTMLRRLAGSPIPGENYYSAEITSGRFGADPEIPEAEIG